ncbi:MAG: FkbM family methyltransferase, partial [Salinarchaeum sp.]
DGSTDGTKEAVTDHMLAIAGRVRYIEVGTSDEPIGIGAARNRGVEEANHEVIAFTDADCRPRPTWLSDLVPYLATNDVVGGRIRPAGGSAASVYEGINSSLDMGQYASRVDPDGSTPYLATANLVGRRRVFESIPFPDRNIAEDVDICWRALDAGFDIVYTPTGIVEHKYRESPGTFAARRSTYAASEALLACEYGRDRGDRVSIPIHILLLFVGVAIALLGDGLVTIVGLVGAGVFAIVDISSDGSRVGRRHGRLPGSVSRSDVLRSRIRERLSATYVMTREITRYYVIPVVIVAVGIWVIGEPAFAASILCGTALAVALPFAVEYRIHDPDVSIRKYGLYYFADHFGYQYGAYRGTFEYRTAAHLDPRGRFRLVGPGTGMLTRFRSVRKKKGNPFRSVTVSGVTARFYVHSSAEKWWFGSTSLRGERLVLRDLLERIESDDVFLDIGANIGLYSCLVGCTLDDGTVIPVEPHPGNATRLAENLVVNDIDTDVVRRALGSTARNGTLSAADEPPGTGTPTLVGNTQSSSGATVHTGKNTVETPVVTGDSLFSAGEIPRPSIVKIDVEGAEVDVLEGLSVTLSTPACRLVYCEVHPEALKERNCEPDDVREELRKRGYDIETVQDLSDGRKILRAET